MAEIPRGFIALFKSNVTGYLLCADALFRFADQRHSHEPLGER